MAAVVTKSIELKVKNKIAVYFNETSAAATDDSLRSSNNKPEQRQKLIIDLLQENENFKCEKTVIPTETGHIEKIILSLNKIHDPGMIDFFRKCYKDWEADGKDQQYFLAGEGVVPINIICPEQFPSKRTHEYYHSKIKKRTWKLASLYADDTITPVGARTFDTILRCADNTLSSVHKLVMEKEKVYCCNTYPGHHSRKRKYGGYCHVNYSALAAKYLLDSTESKVVVLDLDYHAGNGTEDIFREEPNVMCVSIHADTDIDYPTGYGYDGGGENNIINIPMPKGTTIQMYLEKLEIVSKHIKKFEAKYLVVAFGADTLISDPEVSSLGGFAITVDDYELMGRAVSDIGLPTPIVQEGGYNMDPVGGSAAAVVRFLSGFRG